MNSILNVILLSSLLPKGIVYFSFVFYFDLSSTLPAICVHMSIVAIEFDIFKTVRGANCVWLVRVHVCVSCFSCILYNLDFGR